MNVMADWQLIPLQCIEMSDATRTYITGWHMLLQTHLDVEVNPGSCVNMLSEQQDDNIRRKSHHSPHCGAFTLFCRTAP